MPVKKYSENHAVDSTIDRGEQASYVARIRALIEKDQVAQARALLSQALEANNQDPELLSLHELLKPPHGRTRKITDRDRSEEFEWIVAKKWDAYRGPVRSPTAADGADHRQGDRYDGGEKRLLRAGQAG